MALWPLPCLGPTLLIHLHPCRVDPSPARASLRDPRTLSTYDFNNKHRSQTSGSERARVPFWSKPLAVPLSIHLSVSPPTPQNQPGLLSFLQPCSSMSSSSYFWNILWA